MNLMCTGTRDGMTLDQWKVASDLALELFLTDVGPHSFRDGDCEGADTQMHGSVRVMSRSHDLEITMIGHPCTGTAAKWRAYNEYDLLAKSRPPLARNRKMVDASDAVIAAPSGYTEIKKGSGTWATMRYAHQQKKHLLVVWPDGTVTEGFPENGEA